MGEVDIECSGHYPAWKHEPGVMCAVGETLHGRLSGCSREGREPRDEEPGRAGAAEMSVTRVQAARTQGEGGQAHREVLGSGPAPFLPVRSQSLGSALAGIGTPFLFLMWRMNHTSSPALSAGSTSQSWSFPLVQAFRADHWSPRPAGGLLACCPLLCILATRWQQETCQFVFHVAFRSSPLLWDGLAALLGWHRDSLIPRLTGSRVKPRQLALPHTFLRSDHFSSDSPVTGGGFSVLPPGKELSYVPRASLVPRMVKNLPAMQETWVRSLGWEDPPEKGMTTHSSILAWRTPRTEEPGRLRSMGSQRVGHS